MLLALTEYVKTVLENKGLNCDNTTQERIAYSILENEELWNFIDDFITQQINNNDNM